VIDRTHYANPDDDPRGPYTTDPLTGKANAAARPNLHYTITNRETGDVYPADSDFGWITDSKGFDELLSDGRIHWPENPQTGKPRKKRFRSEMDDRAPASSLGISISQGEGNDALIALFGLKIFTFPKPPSVIGRVVDWAIAERGACLDYFAGSGTTGHAVINLNREDGGGRRFILVEMGAYFHTVLKPRIAKVLYAPDWKDGKAQTHNKGVSALVKYFALESYEDALNNLPAPDTGLLDDRPAEERDALIRYALDLEMGPHLLDLDAFRDPWSFTINAQLAGEDEIRPHRVDLVETFNYLIGLKVSAYGPMERYAAQFERAPHDDGLGRLRTVAGPGARQGLRRDPEGPYVFQRVEGTLNDANDTRVLVVWRKLSDDPEKDAAVLDAWMARHQENTKERSPYREAQITYINGPVTLPQPTAELRTVFPLEETFKAKMFEDTDGEGVA
jgi:adenine-specific DNA-methyltransferase